MDLCYGWVKSLSKPIFPNIAGIYYTVNHAGRNFFTAWHIVFKCRHVKCSFHKSEKWILKSLSTEYELILNANKIFGLISYQACKIFKKHFWKWGKSY